MYKTFKSAWLVAGSLLTMYIPGATGGPRLSSLNAHEAHVVTESSRGDVDRHARAPGDSVLVGSVFAQQGRTASLPVYIVNTIPLLSISVPLTYPNAHLTADSVSFAGTRVEDAWIVAESVDTSRAEILMAAIFHDTLPISPGTGLLAHVYFTVHPSAPLQIYVIDSFTASAPAISLNFVDTNVSEYVPGFGAGSIVVVPCLIDIPGDVNTSGTIGSADIIHLVGYVFLGDSDPQPCAANGDVNCNGRVESADIIFLVNHVFRSGPPPCDICLGSEMPCL